MESDAALIREILARECETVSSYESLATRATDPVTRTLILHLAREEKEHIAECAKFLARLDAEYAEHLRQPLQHVLGAAESVPGTQAVESLRQSAETRRPAPGGSAAQPPVSWTVGSLMTARGGAEKAR
jgi:rubrerythrin